MRRRFLRQDSSEVAITPVSSNSTLSALVIWAWGMRMSNRYIRPAPRMKAITAEVMVPSSRASGSRSKNDMASITPPAKPKMAASVFLPGMPKNITSAAPKTVDVPAIKL